MPFKQFEKILKSIKTSLDKKIQKTDRNMKFENAYLSDLHSTWVRLNLFISCFNYYG